MDPLSNPAFLIFAAVSPLLIAFIKQSGFSPQINAIIALICYIVVGTIGVFTSGEALTIENAVPLITIATLVGSAAYGLIWSNLGTGPTGDGTSLDDRLTEATSLIR